MADLPVDPNAFPAGFELLKRLLSVFTAPGPLAIQNLPGAVFRPEIMTGSPRTQQEAWPPPEPPVPSTPPGFDLDMSKISPAPQLPPELQAYMMALQKRQLLSLIPQGR